MLHACFYTICLVFRYTSWHFYAFSGTNLLTRCHSASSLFSAVFVFQKSYTGNILGIGRNKSQTSRNSPKLPENRRGDEVGPHNRAARPRPWPRPLCVRPPRCHGDDLWGVPRVGLYAGWRPRSLHGSKMRRPAPPEGPAASAAG
jgi:hypothetical protein